MLPGRGNRFYQKTRPAAPGQVDWRDGFWKAIDDVRALGFADVFVRMWDFYLASCSAAFAAGRVRDVQVLFEKVGMAAPRPRVSIGPAATPA